LYRDAVEGSSQEIDLRGVRCPVTWARAKVRLELLERGTEVTVVVDDPQSVRDLPRAAEASGHHVIAVESRGAWWTIVLEV
jgi:tRNA 2-thiouridine synthesizing protein A